ncbi:hypothetical protein ANANG_G00026410 [Anguilla anguilla]|uniref:Uncharacterized protein n=1 Tax=Anguilla anguilla TaxID=7936 RepID=A0A9D3S7N9_ANGAN|nr:hypothetical protein ANANG_G00026410 [Anguilla anguilla]
MASGGAIMQRRLPHLCVPVLAEVWTSARDSLKKRERDIDLSRASLQRDIDLSRASLQRDIDLSRASLQN